MPDDVDFAEGTHRPKKTVLGVVVGAWEDALSHDGAGKLFLVLAVAVMTVPFGPLWLLLAAFEAVGVYDVESGWVV